MLPRGMTPDPALAPAATARWAGRSELPRPYQPGDIYLGTVATASEEAVSVLQSLAAFEQELAAASDLASAWLETTRLTISQHRAALMRTASYAVGYRDDRHMATMAGSRSGKGVSCIVPNLLLYPGSVVVIDPKGELAALTGDHRQEDLGQTVAVLAPYGGQGINPTLVAGWNPLADLTEATPHLVDRVASIAGAVVVSAGSGDGVHFDESGRTFLEALKLFVTLNYEGEEKSLLTVHRLLTVGAVNEMRADAGGVIPPDAPDPMFYLLELMAEEQRLDGVVAGGARLLQDMGDRERGSVLSTARRNMAWLNRPAMRQAVARSTFDMASLKGSAQGLTMYLSLPPERMADCSRWLRLMITAAMEACYATGLEPPKTGHPVLFVLDEFATLGHLQVLETAIGYAAGFGVKFWIILQDLGQLKRHYREGFETFLGNASLIQAFGNNDQTTLDYLSRACGETEILQTVTNGTTSLTASSNDPGEGQRVAGLFTNRGQLSLLANPVLAVFSQHSSGQSATTTTSVNQNIVRAPLIQPDELKRHFCREAQNQLLLIAGQRPMEIERRRFFEEPDFIELYRPHDRLRQAAEAAQEKLDAIARRASRAATAIDEARRFLDATKSALSRARAR